MALTTTALVKAYAGITAATDDTIIAAIVSAVIGQFKTFTGRQLESAAFTETHNGRDTEKLAVKNPPISAVSAVSVSGKDYSAADDSQDTGWMYDDRFVYLVGVNRGFLRGARNVVLTYTGGFAVGSDEIKELNQLALEECIYRYRRRMTLGEGNKNLGQGQTLTLEKGSLLESTKVALAKYRVFHG